jgi:hypothetical protein
MRPPHGARLLFLAGATVLSLLATSSDTSRGAAPIPTNSPETPALSSTAWGIPPDLDPRTDLVAVYPLVLEGNFLLKRLAITPLTHRVTGKTLDTSFRFYTDGIGYFGSSGVPWWVYADQGNMVFVDYRDFLIPGVVFRYSEPDTDVLLFIASHGDGDDAGDAGAPALYQSRLVLRMAY